ncbi:MAG: hypothetical protein R2747_10710 [Pyrinomonadaceae bacterium]
MTLKQKFKNAIRRGTGETHILIKENPTVDFSKEIIEAALFNFAYDQQSEGGREIYISELIELSDQKSKILPMIYEALKTEENDDWSIEQLFSIAAIYAKKGDERARKAVYENYYKYAISGSDWCGQDAVVEIDGLEGLKFVAETKGKFLEKNVEEWEDSFFVDNFQKENPQIDVYGELRRFAENNSHIKTYLEMIEGRKFSVRKPTGKTYGYKLIKGIINDGKRKYLPRFAGTQLSEKDLEKLANDFLKETKKKKQVLYLSLFSDVEFPLGYRPILDIAEFTHSNKHRLKFFAVEALRFFESAVVRDFAIQNLHSFGSPYNFAELLIKNYQKGDWKLLKKIAEESKDKDIIHQLACSYIDIYEANPSKECKEPLEIIYSKTNCGIHRTDLVQILIDNKVLSDQIKKEIRYDCSNDTRKVWEKLKPKSI